MLRAISCGGGVSLSVNGCGVLSTLVGTLRGWLRLTSGICSAFVRHLLLEIFSRALYQNAVKSCR